MGDASITQFSKASTANADANRASSRDLSRGGTLPADDAIRWASRSSSVQREKAKPIGSGSAASVRPIDDPPVNSRSSTTQLQQAATASHSGSAVVMNTGSQHTAVA